jgi:hypothetical protein
MESDAVDPCLQAGVAVEAADAAEDLQKNFLRDIGGVAGILQAAGDDGVDGLVILGDEQGEGCLGAGLQLRDEGCLPGLPAYRVPSTLRNCVMGVQVTQFTAAPPAVRVLAHSTEVRHAHGAVCSEILWVFQTSRRPVNPSNLLTGLDRETFLS